MGRFVDSKGLTFDFLAKFPLHLHKLVDSAEATGYGDSKSVKKDFLGFVQLGYATQANRSIVNPFLRTGWKHHVAFNPKIDTNSSSVA